MTETTCAEIDLVERRQMQLFTQRRRWKERREEQLQQMARACIVAWQSKVDSPREIRSLL